MRSVQPFNPPALIFAGRTKGPTHFSYCSKESDGRDDVVGRRRETWRKKKKASSVKYETSKKMTRDVLVEKNEKQESWP